MSHLKSINPSQGYIHKYENLKRKLYNCNANINFNQHVLARNSTSIVNSTHQFKKKKDQPEDGSMTSRNVLLRDLIENTF